VLYFQINVLGVGPTLIAVAANNFFTGIHRPGVSLVATVIANVFNIIANYALIFGHFGFPQLGVAGAAWGTVAASIVNAVLLVVWMMRPTYVATYRVFESWQPSGKRLLGLLKVGTPMGFQFFVDVGMWAVFTAAIVGAFGTVHLAANNIAFRFIELSFMPAVGIGIALTAAVGKAIGRGRLDLAKRTVRAAFGLCVGYMGAVGLGMLLFRHHLIDLLSDDPEVIRWGGYILICCAIFQVFDAMYITFSHALQGAGDTFWPMIVGTLYVVLIFLGGAIAAMYFVPQWGSVGPWIAATVYVIALGLTLAMRYRFGPWASMELPGGEDAMES